MQARVSRVSSGHMVRTDVSHNFRHLGKFKHRCDTNNTASWWCNVLKILPKNWILKPCFLFVTDVSLPRGKSRTAEWDLWRRPLCPASTLSRRHQVAWPSGSKTSFSALCPCHWPNDRILPALSVESEIVRPASGSYLPGLFREPLPLWVNK